MYNVYTCLLMHRVGDILECVNGQSMVNADHREAVRAVKESKGALAVVGPTTYIHVVS